MTPEWVSVVPLAVSKVPDELRVVVVGFRVRVAVLWSVPPLKVRAPVLAPKLLAAEMLKVPALKLVPPE